MGLARARSVAVSHSRDDQLCDHYLGVYWLTCTNLQSVDLSVSITGPQWASLFSLTSLFLSLSLHWDCVREAGAELFSLRAEVIITLRPRHCGGVWICFEAFFDKGLFFQWYLFVMNKSWLIYSEWIVYEWHLLPFLLCVKLLIDKYYLLVQCQTSYYIISFFLLKKKKSGHNLGVGGL